MGIHNRKLSLFLLMVPRDTMNGIHGHPMAGLNHGLFIVGYPRQTKKKKKESLFSYQKLSKVELHFFVLVVVEYLQI